MSDPPDDRPEADPGRSRRDQAFLWTFGICAGLPFLAAIPAAFDTSPEFGFVRFLLPLPWVWGGALLTGITMWGSGSPRGPGVVLGALVGAIVGFTLCSGVLFGIGATR